MSEKIKKVDIRKIQNADIKFCAQDKTEPQTDNMAGEKGIKNLSSHTEVLGRSQVSETDSLKKDVAFGLAHPDAIASADKFFDMTYAQLKAENDPHAYEKASAMSTIYAKERC